MQLWYVGRLWNGAHETQGVFSTEQLAIDACRDETYFIGPLTLDGTIDHNSTEWEGAYFPRATVA